MRLKFSKKSLPVWLYVGGGLLLVVALGLWFLRCSLGSERVFWATIEQGMTARGVTVEADPSNGTITRYSLGAANMAHSITTLTQEGTIVKNEMIGTPTTDYLRYADVTTDQKKADGSPIDFSKILGVWAEGEEGAGQFFTQAVFGGALPIGGMGVPIGNISSEDRAELMHQIRGDHVYEIDFAKVKKEWVHGRLQYVYDVNVHPVGYTALIKSFAQSVGLHDLDQLDPKAYEGQPAFVLQITIDALSRQAVRVTNPDNGGSQIYSGYGVPVQVGLPQETIPGSELQQRLSELQ